MSKAHGKNKPLSGQPRLKTGETLMSVCQGSVIRVQDPNNDLSYFDIDAPKFASKMDIKANGKIEITFSTGYEKRGSKKWIYEVDPVRKALIEIEPIR